MPRNFLVALGLLLVLPTVARADDPVDPTAPPPLPPPPEQPIPPPPPPPPAPDPLAVHMTESAHSLALLGKCEDVEVLAYRVRSLAPDVYREKFATDRAIIACDPRVTRRERATEHVDKFHASGFLLGVDLAIERQPVSSFSTGMAPQTTLAPRMRVFAGYQGQAASIGATLAFDHAAQTNTSDPTQAITTTTSTVLLGPSLRAHLFQGRNARLEVVLAIDFAVGYAWANIDPDPFMQSPPSDFVADLRAGLGLRYWLAPSFAIGAVGGLGLLYQENNGVAPTDGPSQNGAITTSGVDVALSVMGVL